MMFKPVVLILVFAVAGHLALPAPEKSSYASASGYGPDGYKYASDPHSVYVSGPGYYAGASSTTNGARSGFPNFPIFQPFQPFVPFPTFTPYNFQYPITQMQNYLNNLQQNTASIIAAAANSGNGYLFQGPGTQIWTSGSIDKPIVTVYTYEYGKPVTVYTLEPQPPKKPAVNQQVPEVEEPVPIEEQPVKIAVPVVENPFLQEQVKKSIVKKSVSVKEVATGSDVH